jgi:hypothetical protein
MDTAGEMMVCGSLRSVIGRLRFDDDFLVTHNDECTIW